MDSVVCFVNTYTLDSDLSNLWRYPAFAQLWPGDWAANPINALLFKSVSACSDRKSKIARLGLRHRILGPLNGGQVYRTRARKFVGP